MGVTESTIKTRLHRARAKLAENARDNLEITLEDHTYEHASV